VFTCVSMMHFVSSSHLFYHEILKQTLLKNIFVAEINCANDLDSEKESISSDCNIILAIFTIQFRVKST
jgi:hypothetical protein